MISRDLARTVFGILGNATSLCLFLSPAPTFVRIYKNKSVEQFPRMPYIAALLNCMLWVLYGLPFVKPNSLLVLTINGAGVAIELCYVVLFFTYSEGARRRTTVLLFLADVAFVSIVAAVVLSLCHTHGKRTLVIGVICIFFCIMMYAAPLAAMRTVIKTKSVEFMPFYLSMASFLNGFCWTIYSLLQLDINVLVPNSLGLMFSVAQLLLHAIYYRSTKKQLAERTKGDVVLACIGDEERESEREREPAGFKS